ncbi:gamma carbonic anhydrase family protein [Congregibacter variabilis]|uniref:Gamma carbonic anhydrase family protein n=1 Tax=Congregibacter variabilis TaxID=3081200 RepID=A0ABZ0I4F3_9GAMM|nr:gamma carbonic anhydrase family protein [Congregibacter sp. IMCC43200]
MLYKLGDASPVLEGEGHFIAPNAAVIGSVTLGDKSSVWFSCVLRADVESIEVGSGSNIQDGTVVHADPGFPARIGDNVTVGHNAMIHGCTIGDGTLIGINAVILNGATVGKSCLIGANALVTEGMDIPDGSLVMGSPAVVRKTLSPDQQAMLALNADHYSSNAARFNSELEALL